MGLLVCVPGGHPSGGVPGLGGLGQVFFLAWPYTPDLVVQDESPKLGQVGKAMFILQGCYEIGEKSC